MYNLCNLTLNLKRLTTSNESIANDADGKPKKSRSLGLLFYGFKLHDGVKMKSNDIARALATNLNVTLEDNAQVEVNFNIDTDEDGAPVEDAVEDVPGAEINTDEEDEAAEEAAESEADADNAEADMDQLQEAQDSLESLGESLYRHSDNQTVSRMGMGFYKLALESIVGESELSKIGIPSFESREYNKHHAAILALESHAQIVDHINTVSMEAGLNWLKKLKHKIAVLFRGEKALLKRAEGLYRIAQTSKNEQASNDQITVNEKKGLNLNILTSKKWTDEKEFLTHVQQFANLYREMAELRDGYSDEFVDMMFPESRKWPRSGDDEHAYPMFGIKLVRKELVVGHLAKTTNTPTTVPNLTPAMCEKVLVEVMDLLRKGNMVRDNIHTMIDVCEKAKVVEYSTSDTHSQTGNTKETTVHGSSTTVHTKESYPDGYLEMLETLNDLQTLKNKTVTEILNYVNYSLTDREFN